MVVAHLVQRGQRLVAGDVTPELGRLLVGPHDHCHRVPTNDRAQPSLKRGVARKLRLPIDGDGVDVRRVEAGDRARTGVLGPLDHPGDDLPRPFDSVVGYDRVERLQPLAGLDRVEVSARTVFARSLGVGAIRHLDVCPLGVACGPLYIRLLVALTETDDRLGPPWERPLSGRLERLAVNSELLRDNPLGDPPRRPLYVYLSPGVAVGRAGSVPVVYLLQGYGNQLDTWLARKPFEPTIVERL